MKAIILTFLLLALALVQAGFIETKFKGSRVNQDDDDDDHMDDFHMEEEAAIRQSLTVVKGVWEGF